MCVLKIISVFYIYGTYKFLSDQMFIVRDIFILYINGQCLLYFLFLLTMHVFVKIYITMETTENEDNFVFFLLTMHVFGKIYITMENTKKEDNDDYFRWEL